MSELHFPWLEASVLIALIGAIWVGRLKDQFVASRYSLFFNTLVLITTVGAWIDYEFINPTGVAPHEAQDYWNKTARAGDFRNRSAQFSPVVPGRIAVFPGFPDDPANKNSTIQLRLDAGVRSDRPRDILL